jgi:glycosyltransferase involved in cell wall biosynthesis
LAQDYDGLFVLVSDNASSDETRDVVQSMDDTRITYLNTGSRLSMSHNWEFALSHANGEWITVLGDDDGLLPGALTRFAELTTMSDALAIRSQVCDYSWPQLLASEYGRLTIPLERGFKIRNSRTELYRVLDGVQSYRELPMLYNGGFIKKTLLDEVKRLSGRYISSMIPDVYSAITLSRLTPSYGFSMEPLAINGGSKHSTGSSFFSGDKAPSAPSIQFARERNIPLHEDIGVGRYDQPPRSIEILAYESELQSDRFLPTLPRNSRARRLAAAIARSGPARDELESWAVQFCAHHGLSYQAIKRASRLHAITIRARALPARIRRKRLTIDGNSDLPLADVNEASIAAQQLLIERHSSSSTSQR